MLVVKVDASYLWKVFKGKKLILSFLIALVVVYSESLDFNCSI
jgi:hypothetical protein